MTVLEADTLKKTPLYDRHLALRGRIVNFGGWALPVQYPEGILREHKHVRDACGIFDVSHLGEIRVKGPGAFRFLQFRLTNDLARLGDGRMQYHLLCDESGRTLDDVLVYREGADDFYLIVNAASIDRDMEAILQYAPESVRVENQSDETACVAVQGPLAESALEKLFGWDVKTLRYYSFRAHDLGGRPVWVSRSGYTGEDGFEIFTPNALIGGVWDRLANDGQALGVKPAGLGARDTLRLEAGNALYGHDLDPTTTPIEAGLTFAVAFGKDGGFVGRDRLLGQKEEGPSRRLVAFRMDGREIPREGYGIFHEGRKVGAVTSGSFGPTAGAGIGLGYVQRGHDALGNKIEIEVRGERSAAEIVKRPFVELKHKKG